MRHIDRDSLPHLVDVVCRKMNRHFFTFWARLAARWWGVHLDSRCAFSGRPRFRRHPGSSIVIGTNCRFNSSSTSNLIGINHPCIISTLGNGADIQIGTGCGFSGTTIACARRIVLGHNVRCGANTLITDTDWHLDDPRAGKPAPILIEENVWLGEGVKVLKGVTIGKNTVIGAGSVISKSIPANVIIAGNPCKIIKQINNRNEN